MTQGFFISFEGGEGSGKTTQINRLSTFLNEKGRKVVTTREPGGTAEAEIIRNLLVKRDGGHWSAEAETLLLYAARSMHVAQIVRPALADKKVIISDRFSDSTLAYQGYGHGYALEKIKKLDDLVLEGLKPDLTFILDIDPEKGIERSTRRLSQESSAFDRMEDRFEQLGVAFHEKLREGFLEIARQESKRCVVIDASQPLDVVTEDIQKVIEEKLI